MYKAINITSISFRRYFIGYKETFWNNVNYLGCKVKKSSSLKVKAKPVIVNSPKNRLTKPCCTPSKTFHTQKNSG